MSDAQGHLHDKKRPTRFERTAWSNCSICWTNSGTSSSFKCPGSSLMRKTLTRTRRWTWFLLLSFIFTRVGWDQKYSTAATFGLELSNQHFQPRQSSKLFSWSCKIKLIHCAGSLLWTQHLWNRFPCCSVPLRIWASSCYESIVICHFYPHNDFLSYT